MKCEGAVIAIRAKRLRLVNPGMLITGKCALTGEI